jgi:hypothetical protein
MKWGGISMSTLRRFSAHGVVAAFFFGAAGVGLAAPAAATDGRTAVGMCIDSTASGARCGWAVGSDGSIDICNKNGCITCPSAEGECSVVPDLKHQPPRGLPVGSKVTTPLGAFTVRAVTKKTSIDTVINQAKTAKTAK